MANPWGWDGSRITHWAYRVSGPPPPARGKLRLPPPSLTTPLTMPVARGTKVPPAKGRNHVLGP